MAENGIVLQVTDQETGESKRHKGTGVLPRMALVEQICDYIRSKPADDLSLMALERLFGVSRFSIQKAFKEILGISPRKYVEECRILLLKRNLRNGKPMPRAVYDAGYASHSWLYCNASSRLGMSPASYRRGGEGVEIGFQIADCSIGLLLVAETAQGICSVNIGDSEEKLIEALHSEYPRAMITRTDTVRNRIEAILGYLDGSKLALPFDVQGTDFQRRVWAAILSIPYGHTKSYNELAAKIGRPSATRAVANACGANPVPLVIPCHRVVRKDGTIGGYALGPDTKKFLLELERCKRRSENACSPPKGI